MSIEKTRRIAFNPITRTWQFVFPEDEGYEDSIEVVWSTRLQKWVTIPQD